MLSCGRSYRLPPIIDADDLPRVARKVLRAICRASAEESYRAFDCRRTVEAVVHDMDEDPAFDISELGCDCTPI